MSHLRFGKREVAFALIAACGCSAAPELRLRYPEKYASDVQDLRGGSAGSDVSDMRFRPDLCATRDLRPEHSHLDESALLTFLEGERQEVHVERPRADLVYVTVITPLAERPVRLRVAILAGADEAGFALHQALLQHGEGSFGVRRSNLAVLGPKGTTNDAVVFAAVTKLACWGVFNVAGPDDVFVIPGGYAEL